MIEFRVVRLAWMTRHRSMDETKTTGARKPVYNRTEREAILQQLERILAHPLFRHSKRYPNLLRHIVQLTLDGRAGELNFRPVAPCGPVFLIIVRAQPKTHQKAPFWPSSLPFLTCFPATARPVRSGK